MVGVVAAATGIEFGVNNPLMSSASKPQWRWWQQAWQQNGGNRISNSSSSHVWISTVSGDSSCYRKIKNHSRLPINWWWKRRQKPSLEPASSDYCKHSTWKKATINRRWMQTLAVTTSSKSSCSRVGSGQPALGAVAATAKIKWKWWQKQHQAAVEVESGQAVANQQQEKRRQQSTDGNCNSIDKLQRRQQSTDGNCNSIDKLQWQWSWASHWHSAASGDRNQQQNILKSRQGQPASSNDSQQAATTCRVTHGHYQPAVSFC